MRITRSRAILIAAVAGLLALVVATLLQKSDMPNPLVQLGQSALAVFGVRTAEEPPYEMIDHADAVEIRRYGPRFAAETIVDAEGRKAMNEAFLILAAYIFGGNRQKRDIPMTAPVASEVNTTMAMTAPVAMEGESNTGITMRFFLPHDITPANAPEPTDPRVKLVEIPGETIAALRFTGAWDRAAIDARKEALLAELRRSHWEPIGAPFTQLYDPPFTIPFLRRNEVAVRVAPGK